MRPGERADPHRSALTLLIQSYLGKLQTNRPSFAATRKEAVDSQCNFSRRQSLAIIAGALPSKRRTRVPLRIGRAPILGSRGWLSGRTRNQAGSAQRNLFIIPTPPGNARGDEQHRTTTHPKRGGSRKRLGRKTRVGKWSGTLGSKKSPSNQRIRSASAID